MEKLILEKLKFCDMTPPKLAIADKQQLLRLYCESDLSMAKLAKQFGISASTALRLLQEMMSPEDYKAIVERKKSRRSPEVNQPVLAEQLPLAIEPELEPDFDEDDQKSIVADIVHELVGDDILDGDDEFDDEDESEEELEEDEVSDSATPVIPPLTLTVLPLDAADLAHICYIVVDKSSEMVTKTMQDFKELGQIPDTEQQLLALPVFDNHRAARRFSNPNQKIIKFPSSLIYAAQTHLMRKGITRLFYGGQIYALQTLS